MMVVPEVTCDPGAKVDSSAFGHDGQIRGPNGMLGLYAVVVNGKQFCSAYEVSEDASTNEARKRSAEADLAAFIDDFYFCGCGGPNHKFSGDPDDPSVQLECLECGAVKKLGTVLSKVLAGE